MVASPKASLQLLGFIRWAVEATRQAGGGTAARGHGAPGTQGTNRTAELRKHGPQGPASSLGKRPSKSSSEKPASE